MSARARRLGACAALALAASSAPRAAWAIDPGVSHEPSSDPPLPPDDPTADRLVDAQSRRTWNEGRDRIFLSTTLDVGWVYLRPRVSLGYGRPFNTWFGVDANPVFSGNGLGVYGGLRLSLPRFDIRAGGRYVFAFNREYLNPQDSYDRLDLTSTKGDPARITTLEAEAEFSLPGGPGDVIGLVSGSYVTGIPEGMYVFEETLRIIVNPPWVWRARAGYVLRFGSYRQHSIGVVLDALDVPRREDSKTFRFGPVVRVVLSRHVEVRGSFVPTIYSEDKLGVIGGDFTELGFRYRWATE
jgi:hypothetical protein